MKSGLLSLFKKTFGGEQTLHPLDGKIARQWIKRRLLAVFPELRNDPKALEQAYQSLSLEPRHGSEEGEPGIYYEIVTGSPTD